MVQRLPITQKGLDALEPEELAVFEWQYRLCSHFYAALWEAIKRADDNNLDMLRLGFPTEVVGYYRFSNVSGWWPAVEKKFQEANITEEEPSEDSP